MLLSLIVYDYLDDPLASVQSYLVKTLNKVLIYMRRHES